MAANQTRERELDLDHELDAGVSPPLSHPDGSFDLITASSAFTRIADAWAEWLLELHRLLSDEGTLVVGLAEPLAFTELTGSVWDEDRIGMTVLVDGGDTVVFHSEWWLRAHWGRAFEIVAFDGRGARRRVSLRKREGAPGASELTRAESGDERELIAATANAALLREQLAGSETRHRRELVAQREDFHRELMRKAFKRAHLNWIWESPEAPAMQVTAEYEATLSWRITRPLRAAGRLLRRRR